LIGWLLFGLISSNSITQAADLTLTSPANAAHVRGSVSIATRVASVVEWINFYIDGNYLTSSPPYTISWNSNSVSDGNHTISVNAYDSSDKLVGSASVSVTVNNSSASVVKLTAPGNRATVSSSVTVAATAGSAVDRTNFYIDAKYLASGPPNTISWNSKTVTNGAHTISVKGYGSNGAVLGSSAVNVTVKNASSIAILSPTNGATISGTTAVKITTASGVSTAKFFIDGANTASTTPPSTWNWNTTKYANGSHKVSASAYSSAGKQLGSVSAQVTVLNGQQVPPGKTIPGLTGSAGRISGADTNPADYGKYNAPGGSGAGHGLIGGPLLTDLQAAYFVKVTQKSQIETGPDGSQNEVDNNYFNNIATNNPGNYLNQLRASNGFYAGYTGSGWQVEADRIDGACPIANPTTAEALQWAANKWGINPLLMYAEAMVEAHWDQTEVGDNGRSAGVLQVADRGAGHEWPGFSGSGSMLARENTCFNADFYAGRLYSAFHGLTGETPPNDIGTAIQSWFSGTTSSPGDYTAQVYDALTNRTWVTLEFGGEQVPY